MEKAVNYPYRFQLHLHTSRSYDSRAKIERYARRAVKLGLMGFAVTDHDVAPNRSMIEEIASGYNLVIIPGIEVGTPQGDLVGFFQWDIPQASHINDAARFILGNGGITYLPHPMVGHDLDQIDFDLISVVEIFNSRCKPAQNAAADQFFRKMNKPKACASDSHRVRDIDLATVYLPSKSAEDIRNSLISGNFKLGDMRRVSTTGIWFSVAVGHYKRYAVPKATGMLLQKAVRKVFRI